MLPISPRKLCHLPIIKHADLLGYLWILAKISEGKNTIYSSTKYTCGHLVFTKFGCTVTYLLVDTNIKLLNAKTHYTHLADIFVGTLFTV